jgi:two-component system, response regulator PdtaR
MSDLQNCVLIVDDEALIAELWSMTLEDMGVAICGVAATAEAAISLARQYRPKVILMDIRLRGELDGVDAALAIHEVVGSRIIFVTGSRDELTAARIRMDHATAVLFKPVSDRQFKDTLTAALR